VPQFWRSQGVWFHVHLPLVQTVGAPQGEVDEIGPVDQRARAERGAGAEATRGTRERFRRVGWVSAIRCIVHDPSSTARTRPRRFRSEWRRAVLKTTRQMSKGAAGVDFMQFLAMVAHPLGSTFRQMTLATGWGISRLCASRPLANEVVEFALAGELRGERSGRRVPAPDAKG